jgi:hypothetical protein
LVANAPHLPVHLGAMSEAVRFQVAYYGPGGPGAAEGLQVRLNGRIGMGPGRFHGYHVSYCWMRWPAACSLRYFTVFA